MARQTLKPSTVPVAIVVAGLFGASFLVAALDSRPIAAGDIAGAENLFALSFSDAKRDSMLEGLAEQRGNYENLRKVPLANSVPPALLFDPRPPGATYYFAQVEPKFTAARTLEVPANLEELAYASIGELGALLRARKVTSVQLTNMYLGRLKKYGPELECVVTITEALAMKQAEQADRELGAGKDRGPLHGIPYGAKDLLATAGIRTTWGSVPFKDQVFDYDATVIRKLEEAGAVLVAKMSVGELAWGDVWFGGKTKNPWDLKEGSSGSSAGSASATAAGLVAFAIGTETYGSIVSPASRCGVTGLRPTFGRVSRAGAMALSWSMDKIGPICRSVEECAVVFNAIRGSDGVDQTVVDVPFAYDYSRTLTGLRIGYLKTDFDSAKVNRENDLATLAKLRSLGATLIPIDLPKYPVPDMSIILSAEAAAAFDELTRSGADDQLVRQIKNAWPNSFRTARFIPAVEYIQANRHRTRLIAAMDSLMKLVDVYVSPSFDGDNLLLTNLTGHPCVVLPNGFTKRNTPTSITFIGRLYDEATVLAVAGIYQRATDFHTRRPPHGDPGRVGH